MKMKKKPINEYTEDENQDKLNINTVYGKSKMDHIDILEYKHTDQEPIAKVKRVDASDNGVIIELEYNAGMAEKIASMGVPVEQNHKRNKQRQEMMDAFNNGLKDGMTASVINAEAESKAKEIARTTIEELYNLSNEQWGYMKHDIETTLKDSGERREFETGALRDMSKGKGRCDLLPLSTCHRLVSKYGDEYSGLIFKLVDKVVTTLEQNSYDEAYDYTLQLFTNMCVVNNITIYNGILLVAEQLEAGLEKYGKDNWKKGIPFESYIDSMLRHYLKWMDGWDDEDHYKAMLWNIMCLSWTINQEAY